MNKGPVLIIGALSDIGRSVAHQFASKGYDIQLAGRRSIELEALSNDIKSKFDVNTNYYKFDVLKTVDHYEFVKNLTIMPSILVCAIGLMEEQKESEKKSELRTKVLRTNFEWPINIISDFANIYEDQGYGTIVGISSVAGERGRAKNYIYGSSKAAFTVFLSGLRNRLNKKNVHVLSVLPGTVYTKMTKGLNLPKLLTTYPDKVANKIYHGVINKKDIVYSIELWRYIMLIIKLIPEKIFKKLNI